MRKVKSVKDVKVYLMENDPENNRVVVCRPSYNAVIQKWETRARDAGKAKWASPVQYDRAETRVFPYSLDREMIPGYITVCAENGVDASELEGVSVAPVDVSITRAKITVKRTDKNPCGLTLCPTHIVGDADAVWEYIRGADGLKASVKGVVYDRQERGYFVPSLFLADAYDFLSASENPVFDLEEMEGYVDIVSEWGNLYLYSVPENPGVTPFQYQKEDAQRILDFRRGLLALEMGLGKTLVALMASASVPGSKVVVCPASLRENWMQEIERFFPSKTARISGNSEGAIPENDADYTVISYETLSKRFAEFNSGEIQCIIFDEAHYLKSVNASGFPDSTRAKAALSVMAFTEYAFLLTGTPLVNSNADIWNFCRSAWHPLTLGDFAFASFLQAFTESENSRFGVKVTGYKNSETLFSELSKIMVRRRMLDLPEFRHLEKDRIPVDCIIDAEEYDRKISEYLEKRDNPDERGAALVALTAARIALGREKAKQTVDYLKAISVDNREKFVVFTVFRSDANFIAEKLGKSAVKLTGDLTSAQIEANKTQFQDPESNVRFIVATYAKGGAGHNLDASSNVILSDLPWTWKDTVQAESRIVRATQRKIPHVHYLLARNVDFDEAIRAKVCRKAANANAVVDNGMGDAGLDMKTFFRDDCGEKDGEW